MDGINEFQGTFREGDEEVVQEVMRRLQGAGFSPSSFANVTQSGAPSIAPHDDESGGEGDEDWFILGVDQLGVPGRKLRVQGVNYNYGR